MTGHQHWVRTPAQAAPITEPLARMMARMDPMKKAKLMESIDPAALVVGICNVAGPSVQAEMQYLQGRRAGTIAAPGSAPPPRAARPAPTGAGPDPGKVNDPTGQFVGVN